MKIKSTACKDYHLTRRRMLGVTGASLLGMPVSSIIAQANERAASAEHVVLFWCGGGLSHLDTWDPKPGRPTQGEFNPIKTSADGVQISEIFPKLAKQMHHCSIIRSIAGNNGDHGRASYELQTSHTMSQSVMHPSMGSIVVHERDPLGDLPAFISISGNAPRAGYLGQRCEAYYVGRPGERDPYLAFPSGISNVRGNQRLDLLAKMNIRQSGVKGNLDMKSAETAINSAVDLMKSPALEAFELEKVDPDTLARYGDTDFGRGALLAKRLINKGVRFVQVNRGGFDNHSNIFETMQNHGDTMDPALASLIEDLADEGKLDKTLILVLSEFGRTPRINMNGGRDHHARCFSCLFAGGGVKGGNVIGSSDKDGIMPDERPVKPFDLHASLCHALGIDPAKEMTTPTGRPMRLIREGAKPVQELFA